MTDPSCPVCLVKKSLIFVTQDGNEIEKLKTAYIESIFSTIEGRIKSLWVSSSHSVTNPSEAQSPIYRKQRSQGDEINSVRNASKSEVTCLGCNARESRSKCCPSCNGFLCSNCLTVVSNVSKFLKKTFRTTKPGDKCENQVAGAV